ncbi:PcfJ domain-containing protein [Aminobacter aganoensis]|uniref:Uncharacterized protein n=1 Tax=Aminobacter aganoensis TaxID=83264 RepID=A0A7X0F9T2_9HYPH|nr:PcfJ domain-containing protein [Aminobacter aganoensis]MBB6355742.1 hypothetical protein [Aminobacter aganoensis]
MNATSPSTSWTHLRACSAAELLSHVPAFAKLGTHPAINALVTISAFARTTITARRSVNGVEARVSVKPKLQDDPHATQLVKDMEAAITANACRAGSTPQFDLGTWLDRYGYIDLLAKAVEAGAREIALKTMAEMISKAIATVALQVGHLTDMHLKRLLRRDIPGLEERPTSPCSTLEWLLAVDHSGDPRRPILLTRRWQALRIYASLSTVLREPNITATIDEGLPLKPVLMDRLNITTPELRALRGARSLTTALRIGTDFEATIAELKAHGVPLAEWPGRGEPDQPSAWSLSPWAAYHRNNIIRVDYVSANQHATDAISSLADDILRPVVANRLVLANRSIVANVFLHSLAFPTGLRDSPDRRAFLSILNKAIIGTRGIKAFHEAAELWHRRVATLSAVRHEHRTDRPGWPSICPPWQCPRGLHDIVPITTAGGLVEEGNSLDHCVGGYYQPCRSGAVQILSLKRGGSHVATIELKLSGTTADTLSYQVGQFKARRNQRPDDELHDVLRAFLSDLNCRRHPIFRSQLAAHRKRMQREGDYVWSSHTLPIAHAREVFPFYLPLLPRNTPGSLDAWCEKTGLAHAVDRAIVALSSPIDPGAPIPY